MAIKKELSQLIHPVEPGYMILCVFYTIRMMYTDMRVVSMAVVIVVTTSFSDFYLSRSSHGPWFSWHYQHTIDYTLSENTLKFL